MDEIKDDMLEVNGENILPEEEQLLGQFFAEHQLDVEDRGFTNRVMRRLPDRSVCLNRIWTAICSVAGGYPFDIGYDGLADSLCRLWVGDVRAVGMVAELPGTLQLCVRNQCRSLPPGGLLLLV